MAMIQRPQKQSDVSVPRLPTARKLLVVAIAACFSVESALACVTTGGAVVTQGTACYVQNGNTLNITTYTDRTSIQTPGFSILEGQRVYIDQKYSNASSTLISVTRDPTVINGYFGSNGIVWLVNPNGIMVGPGGRIDTAGFVASTLNVTNADFLANRMRFGTDGLGASVGNVVNQGTITTPAGGSVYLIGKNVSNEGIITTPQGETILAAGSTIELIDTATPGVKVEITGAEGNSTNLGEITATAGRIGIAGVLVRNRGTLNASSVVEEGGRVFLKASQDAYVDGDGRIVTTGKKGGSIDVLGNRVAVMDQASLDASGEEGGGKIRVGGDYQGKNPDIQNAQVTYFGKDASLKVNATRVGAGGTAIVWADDTTRAFGSIEAKGGVEGGNGGLVETSGKKHLDIKGARVDTSVYKGKAGSWLLDPASIEIRNSAGSGGTWQDTNSNTYDDFFVSDGGATSVEWTTIANNLINGNVIMQTASGMDGYISFVAGTYSSSSTNSLTLLALRHTGAGDITIPTGTNISMTNGSLVMIAGWDGNSTSSPAVGATGVGNISITGVTNIDVASLTMKASNNISITNGGSIVASSSQIVEAGDTLELRGDPAVSQRSATLKSLGTQTISAKQITVYGGGYAASNVFGSAAEIIAYGDQVITAGSGVNGGGGIQITGGGATGGYNNSARIQHGKWKNDEGTGTSSGSQSITIKGGGSLTISGGQGTGTSGSYGSECGSACAASNNRAEITNNTGTQTLDFVYGGSISVTGGTLGNDNSAKISNEATTTQKIWSSYGATVSDSLNWAPNIGVYGGASGGTAVWGGAAYGGTGATKVYDIGNSAGISSEGGQTINAYGSSGNAITVYGGATSSVGGAYIGGGGATNITAKGTVVIRGGASDGGPNGYDRFAGGAAIGNDGDKSSISIDVYNGSLNVYGGSGKAGTAMIGSMDGYADISINVRDTGNIKIKAGEGGSTHYGSVLIGSAALTQPPAKTKIEMASYGGIEISGGSAVGYGGVVIGEYFTRTISPSIILAALETRTLSSLSMNFTPVTTTTTTATALANDLNSATSSVSATSSPTENNAPPPAPPSTETGSGSGGSSGGTLALNQTGSVGGTEGTFGGGSTDTGTGSSGPAPTGSTSTGDTSTAGSTGSGTSDSGGASGTTSGSASSEGSSTSGDKQVASGEKGSGDKPAASDTKKDDGKAADDKKEEKKDEKKDDKKKADGSEKKDEKKAAQKKVAQCT